MERVHKIRNKGTTTHKKSIKTIQNKYIVVAEQDRKENFLYIVARKL